MKSNNNQRKKFITKRYYYKIIFLHDVQSSQTADPPVCAIFCRLSLRVRVLALASPFAMRRTFTAAWRFFSRAARTRAFTSSGAARRGAGTCYLLDKMCKQCRGSVKFFWCRSRSASLTNGSGSGTNFGSDSILQWIKRCKKFKNISILIIYPQAHYLQS